MRLVILLVCCVAFPHLARAQVAFPPDPAWTALRCGARPMSDRVADQAGAIDDRDIVGDAAAPAGLRASDATHLYLRMRLDKDPAPGGAIRGFAWGMQFDLDGDLSTYELMVIVDGTAGPAAASVALLRNTVTTSGNDPSDPADAPAVATYPLAMNARSIPAPGSSFGGTGDFFLDFAVPWSALAPLGLGRTTPTHVWAGTSTVANGLDGDLACHDGATGAARLDQAASDRTTGDPAQDPAGGPGGTGQLEGGGGCSAGGAGAPSSAFALAIALLGIRRRRR